MKKCYKPEAGIIFFNTATTSTSECIGIYDVSEVRSPAQCVTIQPAKCTPQKKCVNMMNAGMAELVDAPDLGSGGIPCPSSSLGTCTINSQSKNFTSASFSERMLTFTSANSSNPALVAIFLPLLRDRNLIDKCCSHLIINTSL